MTAVNAILLVLCLAAAGAAPVAAQGPPASPEETRPLNAVVRSFDPATRTVEMITGVGHALRLVRVSLAPECRITRSGAGAVEGDLEAGAVCRVQVRRTAAGDVALAIEIQEEGGKP